MLEVENRCGECSHFIGGDRWNDEPTPLDDDWYFYKTEKKRRENPLDDDYIPEKRRKAGEFDGENQSD